MKNKKKKTEQNRTRGIDQHLVAVLLLLPSRFCISVLFFNNK